MSDDWLRDMLNNASSTLYCPEVPTPLELIEEIEEDLIDTLGINLNNTPIKR